MFFGNFQYQNQGGRPPSRTDNSRYTHNPQSPSPLPQFNTHHSKNNQTISHQQLGYRQIPYQYVTRPQNSHLPAPPYISHPESSQQNQINSIYYNHPKHDESSTSNGSSKLSFKQQYGFIPKLNKQESNDRSKNNQSQNNNQSSKSSNKVGLQMKENEHKNGYKIKESYSPLNKKTTSIHSGSQNSSQQSTIVYAKTQFNRTLSNHQNTPNNNNIKKFYNQYSTLAQNNSSFSNQPTSINEEKHKYFRDNLELKSQLEKMQEKFANLQYENYILKNKCELAHKKKVKDNIQSQGDGLQNILMEEKNRSSKNQAETKILREKIKELEVQLNSLSSQNSNKSDTSKNNDFNHSIVEPYVPPPKKYSTAVSINQTHNREEQQKFVKLYENACQYATQLLKTNEKICSQKSQMEKQCASLKYELEKYRKKGETQQILSFTQHRTKLGFRGNKGFRNNTEDANTSNDQSSEYSDNFKMKTPKSGAKSRANPQTSPFSQCISLQSPANQHNAYYTMAHSNYFGKEAQNLNKTLSQIEQDREQLRKRVKILMDENMKLLKQNKNFEIKVQETYTRNIQKEMQIEGLKQRFSKQIEDRNKIIERISYESKSNSGSRTVIQRPNIQNQFSFRPKDDKDKSNNGQMQVIKSQSKHIEELTQQLYEIKDATNADIESKSIQIKSLRMVNEELVQKNSEYEQQIGNLTYKNKEMTKKYDICTTENQSMKSKITALEKQLVQLKNNQNSSKSLGKEEQLQRTVDDKNQQIDKLTQYADTLHRDKKQLQKQIEELQQKLSEQKKHIQNSEEKEELTLRIQELAQEINSNKQIILKYEQELNSLQNKLQVAQIEKNELISRIDHLNSGAKDKQLQLEASKIQIQLLQQEKSHFQGKLAEMKQINEEMQKKSRDEIQQLTKKIDQSQKRMEQLEVELLKTKDTNEKLEKQLQRESKEQKEQRQNELLNEIEILRESILVEQAKVKDLSNQIESNTNKMHEEQTRMNKQIEGFQSKIIELQTLILEKQEQITNQNTNLQTLQVQLQSLAQELALTQQSHSKELSQKQQTLTTYETTIQQLNTKLNNNQQLMQQLLNEQTHQNSTQNLMIESEVFSLCNESVFEGDKLLMSRIQELEQKMQAKQQEEKSVSKQYRESLQEKDLKNQQIEKQLVVLTHEIEQLKSQLQTKQVSSSVLKNYKSERSLIRSKIKSKNGDLQEEKEIKIVKKQSNISETSLTSSKELWLSKDINKEEPENQITSYERLEQLEAAINSNQQLDKNEPEEQYIQVNYHALLHICDLLNIEAIDGQIISSIIEHLQSSQDIYMVMDFYVQILDLFGICSNQPHTGLNMSASVSSLKEERDIFINSDTHCELLKEIKSFRENMKLMLQKSRQLQTHNEQLMKDFHRSQKHIKKLQQKVDNNFNNFLVVSYEQLIHELNGKMMRLQTQRLAQKYKKMMQNEEDTQNELDNKIEEIENEEVCKKLQ